MVVSRSDLWERVRWRDVLQVVQRTGSEIVLLEDPRGTSDANAIGLDTASVSEIVNIGSDPSAVVAMDAMRCDAQGKRKTTDSS